MAELPDDVETEGTPERAELDVRLACSGVDAQRVLAGLCSLLDATAHLTYAFQRPAQHGSSRYLLLTLSAERTGVVGPALDDLCGCLREVHASYSPRVRVPGYTRTFYGWEKAIWDAAGRFVEENP